MALSYMRAVISRRKKRSAFGFANLATSTPRLNSRPSGLLWIQRSIAVTIRGGYKVSMEHCVDQRVRILCMLKWYSFLEVSILSEYKLRHI